MEALTTSEAAARAGVTVRQWHYWADKLDVQPVRQLAGQRGTKLWDRRAVNKVARSVGEAA